MDLPEACKRAWHRAPSPIGLFSAKQGQKSKLGAAGGAPLSLGRLRQTRSACLLAGCLSWSSPSRCWFHRSWCGS